MTRTGLAGSSSWVSETLALRSGAASPVLSNEMNGAGVHWL